MADGIGVEVAFLPDQPKKNPAAHRA
jgi:hypothetical protein